MNLQKILKKCPVCGEMDMIEIGENICKDCSELEKTKNKELLKI